MKTPLFLLLGALILSSPLSSLVRADSSISATSQIESLKKTYPLTTCPVSGDALNNPDMGGKPVDYLYTQKNADGTEITRLVRFCCRDCLKTFKKSPEKYLKVVDEAQAKETASTTKK